MFYNIFIKQWFGINKNKKFRIFSRSNLLFYFCNFARKSFFFRHCNPGIFWISNYESFQVIRFRCCFSCIISNDLLNEFKRFFILPLNHLSPLSNWRIPFFCIYCILHFSHKQEIKFFGTLHCWKRYSFLSFRNFVLVVSIHFFLNTVKY